MAIHTDSGMVVHMTYSRERWHSLGEQLVRRRIELGYPKRTEFARHLRLTHDRTLSDIENGRRSNYSAATIGQVENYYGLAIRAIPDFLEGASDVLAVDPGTAGGAILEAASAHGRDLEGMLSVVDIAGTTAHRRSERGDEGGAWDALYALYTLLASEFTGQRAPVTRKDDGDGTAIATQRQGGAEGSAAGHIRSLSSDELGGL